MTINSPRVRTESERRQSEADELEFKPGPVPPIRPVDRYGFVKSAPTSPASGPTKGRPQSERERSVLSLAFEQVCVGGAIHLLYVWWTWRHSLQLLMIVFFVVGKKGDYENGGRWLELEALTGSTMYEENHQWWNVGFGRAFLIVCEGWCGNSYRAVVICF